LPPECRILLYFIYMKIIMLLAISVVYIPPVLCQSLVEPPYLHSYGIRKATSAKLFIFFGPFTTFSDPQGIATAKMKSRDDPKTDKDDDEVVVYGVNSGRNQIIYNTSMWTLGLFGSKGSGKDRFLSPKGIAADPDGNVYVADCGNNRIVHLFNPKRDVHWVNDFTGRTATDPGLVSPSQVGLDKKGRIYVTDPGNRRVVVFSPGGGAVSQIIPANNQFVFDQGPSMLAIADGAEQWSFFTMEHSIFCADKGGKRLWKINVLGTVEKQALMPSGHAAGYAAIDYFHNLWVTDRNNHCVLKFDHNLELLDIFGSYGDGKNQFIEPRGIALWKRYGQVFIAEKNGAQYYWIGTDLKAKSLRKISGNTYTLSLALTECSYVSLYAAVAKDTQWVFNRWMVSAGKPDLPFEDRMHILTQNRQCVLKVEPTYSSFSYFKLDFPVQVDR
jgi:DNA-binding beta-propeller fold protein YncE